MSLIGVDLQRVWAFLWAAIMSEMGNYLVLLYNSSFLVIFGYFMFRHCLNCLLWNEFRDFSVALLEVQVEQLYRKMDLTWVLVILLNTILLNFHSESFCWICFQQNDSKIQQNGIQQNGIQQNDSKIQQNGIQQNDPNPKMASSYVYFPKTINPYPRSRTYLSLWRYRLHLGFASVA